MNIVINPAMTRKYTDERGTRQVVYFTLTDDNAVEYRACDDIPGDVDAQKYLDAHVEQELLFIRSNEYPGMPHFSELASAELWIAAGCQTQRGTDDEGNPIYGTVSKKTWVQRWNIVEAAKAQAMIDNMPSWSQVDASISAIANLADAKAFIRKLARVLYWLAKDKAD